MFLTNLFMLAPIVFWRKWYAYKYTNCKLLIYLSKAYFLSVSCAYKHSTYIPTHFFRVYTYCTKGYFTDYLVDKLNMCQVVWESGNLSLLVLARNNPSDACYKSWYDHFNSGRRDVTIIIFNQWAQKVWEGSTI